MSQSMIGNEMRRIKENGLRSEEELKMQVRRKMWLLTRILMNLSLKEIALSKLGIQLILPQQPQHFYEVLYFLLLIVGAY